MKLSKRSDSYVGFAQNSNCSSQAVPFRRPSGAVRLQAPFSRTLAVGFADNPALPRNPELVMARILLNTFGSLGDLHPYLALAIALQRRGHTAVLATSAVYRKKVEAEGLEFAAVRPDVGELVDKPEFTAKLWDNRRGTEYLLRDYLIPQVKQSFEDLQPACRGADLLLTHAAGYAGPIVGELLRMRWSSVALQPAVFFSSLDPSVVAAAPWARHLYRFGPTIFRLLLRVAERELAKWIVPILELRRSVGLRPPSANPVTLGQFSPWGTLALFSRHFAVPQGDWPTPLTQTGFVFFDRLGDGLPGSEARSRRERPGQLEQFLQAGKPPVLFTLGSSAVLQAGNFYRDSLRAIEQIGERAILLVGDMERAQLKEIPESVFVTDYVPYSEVMPRVAAIVHQGGIGTTGQSLRAGKPMLVVPWAHDQPDNAERLRKIGVARWVERRRYSASVAAAELRELLRNQRYRAKAEKLGAAVRAEDGERTACEAIERLLPDTSARNG